MVNTEKSKICPNCGTENRSGTISCNNCGHSLIPEHKRLPYARLLKRFCAFLIDDVLLFAAVFAILWAVVTYNYGFIEFLLLAHLVRWIYFAGFHSSRYQATIGKIILGIKVTDPDGNRISFGKATARAFSKILSQLIFFGGYVMAAFTEKRQGLHDKMADTVVVKKIHEEKKHPLYKGLE